MSQLTLPYNFVPLSRFILRPAWADQASHDHPFADGLCGELAYTLTSYSPLCVGGKQTPSSDTAPGTVHFYRTPDNAPAIPGSSLKGMLRAVTEIATFAHFRQLEERRLGVRDLHGQFYKDYMVKHPSRAGWLSFREGQWYLTPCQFVRVHQQNLIDHLGIQESKWIRTNKAAKRYELIGGLKELSFTQAPHKTHPNGIATQLGQGDRSGTLVVTGQPGAHFKQNKRAKKWEFVFYKPGEPLPVPQAVMTDFQFIHGESDEWAYWKARLGQLTQGVPVFYHTKPDGTPRSIGLSMMYKLTYEHSLLDAVTHTQPAHLETGAADMADLLFGRINTDDAGRTASLRGRVSIGLARCETPEPRFSLTEPTVLNGPKPTFYPAYIRQPEQGGYHTLMDRHAELSGWKRYPVKDPHIQPPADGGENKKVQVRLETLPSDTRFCGTIRFHNLRPAELGALLWSLDFGERGYLSHSLGTGKPYGCGEVRIKLDPGACRLRANDPTLEVADTALVLGACRRAFDSFIQEAWSGAVNEPEARWDQSAQLTQLLEMADSAKADTNDNLVYMTDPGLFAKAKNAQEVRVDYAPPPSPTVAPPASYQPSPSDASLSLDDALQQQHAMLAQQAQDAERAQARATMSEEARCLDDIQAVLAKESLSKTDRKELEKHLRQALADLDNAEYEHRAPLGSLIAPCDALGIKPISKLCKKIRERLDD